MGTDHPLGLLWAVCLARVLGRYVLVIRARSQCGSPLAYSSAEGRPANLVQAVIKGITQMVSTGTVLVSQSAGTPAIADEDADLVYGSFAGVRSSPPTSTRPTLFLVLC